MGLSYKVDSLPATLREGEFAVVNGVVYVGDASNTPVALATDKGYRELNILLEWEAGYENIVVVTNDFSGAPGVAEHTSNQISLSIPGVTNLQQNEFVAQATRNTLLIGEAVFEVRFDNNDGWFVVAGYDSSGQAIDAGIVFLTIKVKNA